MSAVKVSIIVPMYNASKWIQPLIESIAMQTEPSWELIIIDDHSTDNSIEIANIAAQNDSRITIIKRPVNIRKGGDACRNYGMDIATGEYIIFVDADDVLAPYCLSQRTKALDENLNIDCGVFPALAFIGDLSDSNFVGYHGYNYDKPLNRLINKALPFVVWNNIYRKSALINNNIRWDENLMSNQDADFNISCLLNNLTYHSFNTAPDYFWRQTMSLSKKIKSKEHSESNIYYFNKISKMFDSDRRYDKDLNLLSYWIYDALFYTRDKNIINNFLQSDFFKNRKFLRSKYKAFQLINSKFNIYNPRIVKLCKLLYFPQMFIRRRIKEHSKPFNKTAKKNLNTLISLYKSM